MVTERILATTPRFVCPRMDHLARIAIDLSILGRALKSAPFFLKIPRTQFLYLLIYRHYCP
jgi:hypothetical protein